LRLRLDDLKTCDSRYIPFADSLLTLTRQFQTEEIEALLNRHLTADSNHV